MGLDPNQAAGQFNPVEIEEPGFRLNTPLPDDTFDPTFTPTDTPLAIAAMMRGSRSRPKKPAPTIIVTAIIDDGIAFAHRNFRDKQGKTRVESCWLQSGKADGSGRVLFGRELFRREIDDLIERAGGDELAVYASVPMSEVDTHYGAALNRFATHGTHVLDIAAGHCHGRRDNPLPAEDTDGMDRVRIIAVQLPPSAIADTSGFGDDAYILSAFHHIFERADAIFSSYGITKPEQQCLTVNFSFGFTGGPHNGSGRIERAIQQLIAARRGQRKPTEVVMPAGNTFASALYGEIRPMMLKDSNEYAIPWRVQPNSRSASHLELWFPANPAGSMITLTPPGGGASWQLSLDDIGSIQFPAGRHSYGQAAFYKFAKDKWQVVISLAPTEPADETLPASPSGLWRIAFQQPEKNRFENPVYCRIQRCENPFGYATGARQSYFDDPLDEPFDETGAIAADDTEVAFVRRFGSLNGLAISGNILIVGGALADSGKPSLSSAAGPNIKQAGHPDGFVDLSAPSDDSRVLPGRRAAATLSGSNWTNTLNDERATAAPVAGAGTVCTKTFRVSAAALFSTRARSMSSQRSQSLIRQ